MKRPKSTKSPVADISDDIAVADIPDAGLPVVEVADLFCGAGGSSTGAQKAIESLGAVMKLRAINHWNVAIDTHARNHPDAIHVIEDVSVAKPQEIVPDGHLDILMASPECTYHSRARGGKPINDQGRMNPWVIHRWLTELDISHALIENVPEFVNWGPLDENDRPIKSRKGEYFQAWFLTFQNLGYTAEWRMLNAADYGDATTRTRFFLIAHKGEQPVTWPEPTHAKANNPMFPGRLPWRPAKEIINWNNLGRSILDDPKYRKKPLAENTLKRIAKGMHRYVNPVMAPLYVRLLDLPDDEPAGGFRESTPAFIMNRHGENGTHRTRDVETPFNTVTCRGAGHMVVPIADPFTFANRNNSAPKGMDQPIACITTAAGGGIMLWQPDAQPFCLGQQSGGAPRPIDQPIQTIATGGKIQLVVPFITHYYSNSVGQSINTPLGSHAGDGQKHGIVTPTLFLVEYYSGSDTASAEEPLHTVTTKDRHAIASPAIIELAHGNGHRGDRDNERRVHSVEEPLGSITTKPGIYLTQAMIVKVSQTGRSGRYSRSIEEPIPTVTTKNDTTLAIPTCKPFLTPNFGEAPGQDPRTHDIDEPLPTVASHGAGNLVTPAATEATIEDAAAPGIDPRRIVFINGVPHLLDIRFRMLENEELARAMGFDDSEQRYQFSGNKTEITKQIGNAVPVRLASALVSTILS